MPCPGDRKYRQGLKPLCLFVLNGTTKVVPSRRSESCALPLRPQVPLGLKPRCLFVLNGTRLKSCPPTWAKVVPLRLRPQVLQGLKRPVHSSLNGTTKVVPSQLERNRALPEDRKYRRG